MEARRQPEPATLAELVKLSDAADWEGCDVRQFSLVSAAKLVALGKAERYTGDVDGEKAKVDAKFALYKAASSRAVQSREEWIKVAEELGLDPASVRKQGWLASRLNVPLGCSKTPFFGIFLELLPLHWHWGACQGEVRLRPRRTLF